MKQAAIQQINKRNLSSKCHINKHPIPNLIKIIFLEPTNIQNLGKIHLTHGQTKQNKIKNGEENTKNLISSKASRINNANNIGLNTIII